MTTSTQMMMPIHSDEPSAWIDYDHNCLVFKNRSIEFVMDVDLTFWFKATQVGEVLSHNETINISRMLRRCYLLPYSRKLQSIKIHTPVLSPNSQPQTLYINTMGLLLLAAQYRSMSARLFHEFLYKTGLSCFQQRRDEILHSNHQDRIQQLQDENAMLGYRFVQPTTRLATRYSLKIIKKPHDFIYPYYAIRRQQRDIHRAYKQLKTGRFQDSYSILELEDVSNAVNIFNVVNQHKDKIQRKMNHFRTSLSEDELIKLIYSCVGYTHQEMMMCPESPPIESPPVF